MKPHPMGHRIKEPADCRCRREDERCPTCDWGLSVCADCGMAEVELDRPCPARLPTSGPWEFDPGGDGGDESVGVPSEPPMVFHEYDAEARSVVGVAEVLSTFVYGPAHGRYVGSLTANGHLIAAAPDLLAACEAALEVFRDFGLEHMVVFDQIGGAVDKAKGQAARGR